MRTLPVEHSKFIWDTVSYITSLQAFFDFAAGCDLPVYIVRRAIKDNDPSDGEVSLENYVAQALVIWWLSSNRPAVWKSNKEVKQGFVKLHMPDIHSCLVKRHPTLDPDRQNNNSQKELQPGPSGQMSKRPVKYQTMEYIVLHLKNYEFDFFKELSRLIQTPENAYGLACITNLPDPTFAHIRHAHTKFGLSVKEIHGRIVLHILGIWYLQAKDKFHIIPMIMEMFRDLELYDECEEVIELSPEMNDGNRIKPTPKKVHMGTKLLKKGHKVKSSTTTSQGYCSSTSPLNSIRENGEVVEVEEQMPELVDISDDGDTNGDQQSLITFGQARLTNMGDTTENLSQGVNVTFEVDNENTDVSRDIPPNPHVLLKNLRNLQKK